MVILVVGARHQEKDSFLVVVNQITSVSSFRWRWFPETLKMRNFYCAHHKDDKSMKYNSNLCQCVVLLEENKGCVHLCGVCKDCKRKDKVFLVVGNQIEVVQRGINFMSSSALMLISL